MPYLVNYLLKSSNIDLSLHFIIEMKNVRIILLIMHLITKYIVMLVLTLINVLRIIDFYEILVNNLFIAIRYNFWNLF